MIHLGNKGGGVSVLAGCVEIHILVLSRGRSEVTTIPMGIMMALPVLDAIPKEMYLLIGTVLGSVVTMVATLINTRAQERIARETRQQQ